MAFECVCDCRYFSFSIVSKYMSSSNRARSCDSLLHLLPLSITLHFLFSHKIYPSFAFRLLSPFLRREYALVFVSHSLLLAMTSYWTIAMFFTSFISHHRYSACFAYIHRVLILQLKLKHVKISPIYIWFQWHFNCSPMYKTSSAFHWTSTHKNSCKCKV